MQRRHRRGDVAQLGERGLCKPEVEGSNPFVSTNFTLGNKQRLDKNPSEVGRTKKRRDAN